MAITCCESKIAVSCIKFGQTKEIEEKLNDVRLVTFSIHDVNSRPLAKLLIVAIGRNYAQEDLIKTSIWLMLTDINYQIHYADV